MSDLSSSVPLGTSFSTTHNLWMQSRNEMFQLGLRSWVDQGIEQCISGVRYSFKTTHALIWTFNTVLEPLQLTPPASSSPIVAWQTPTAGLHVQNLTLQDDGNLVLVNDSGGIVWQSFNYFQHLFMIPSGMRFLQSMTMYDRVSLYSDYSTPGCYALQMGSQGCLQMFTRANMYVYHTIGINTSTSRENAIANYIIINQDREFYSSQGTLMGTVAHNVLDGDPLPKANNLTGSALFKDSNLLINRPSPSNPNYHLWYYNSSISGFCDFPLVCGEYGLCNEATKECSCPARFELTSTTPAYTVQDEPTRKCSCPEVFQMPKFSSTCIPVNSAYSLSPVNISFYPQPLFVCPLKKHAAPSVRRMHLAMLPSLIQIALRVLSSPSSTRLHYLLKTKQQARGFKHSHGYCQGGSKRLDQAGASAPFTMDDQFKAEVATIGSVSHLNLVTLKGFCMEKNVRLLVFEFMPKGSLDKWLYTHEPQVEENIFSTSESKKGKVALAGSSTELHDWEKRCRIALDTAKGLEYLHHQTAEHIVHCDVKPANILLTEDFHAKVGDFGLAKLTGSDTQSFAMTTLKGTRGYLAPEWLRHARITAKFDVYSYGVVLLELLTGKKCLDPEYGHIPTWLMDTISATKQVPTSTRAADSTMLDYDDIDASPLQEKIMDGRLPHGSVCSGSFQRVLFLALACVQVDPSDRPRMTSVVQMLEDVLEISRSTPFLKLSELGHNYLPVNLSG
ncbi:hypothetical protein L7F22_045387 [Adiantum nelumboides]|nr:hypothetical protein [Adiantum nelumboides]